METIKQRQAGELVKRHFSMVLQDEGSYVYGTAPLVTVTTVKMSPDMSLAKIYLSVYNTENKQAVLLEMEEEKHRLKQLLGARLRKHVRRIPDIDFYMDDTLDEMARLQDLFKRLHDENAMGTDDDSSSSS